MFGIFIRYMTKHITLIIIFLLICQTQIHGQVWAEVGGPDGLYSGVGINGISTDAAGNIYVAADDVLEYDGTSWRNLGLVSNGYVRTLFIDPWGTIFACGDFLAVYGYYVSQYDGMSWSEVGLTGNLAANGPPNSICEDTVGNVYTAGSFRNRLGYFYVAQCNGAIWTELGGINALHANLPIHSICSDKKGNIYAAGEFTNGSGNYYVAKYDGTVWSELGGVNALGANGYISALYCDASGDICAAGAFADSLGFAYVAKYDGARWIELGGANSLRANMAIYSICGDAAGNIYVGGAFLNPSGFNYVAKYNGLTWSEVGGPSRLAADGPINAVCLDPSNNLYASGNFHNISGNDRVSRYGFPEGINTMQEPNLLSLAPNPTLGKFKIYSPSKTSTADIRVYNSMGANVIIRKGLSGSVFAVDVSSQPSGVYFVEVIQEGEVWTGKLIKSN